METTTLVDNPRPIRSHRATTTSTRTTRATARDGVRPVSPAGPPAAAVTEGRVYRTTYLPPGLHVALVGLYLLALLGGVALGIGIDHYVR